MTLYPKDMWLHIYTVGSSQNDGSAGAGFYCENLFGGSLAAGLGITNCDAEIEVVRQVICHLTNLSISYIGAVFLVDSKSKILTLCSLHNSDSMEEEKIESQGRLECHVSSTEASVLPKNWQSSLNPMKPWFIFVSGSEFLGKVGTECPPNN
ncbi:uncharacterized protein TNIN_72221 [Trichonephila inaurata madagascariensis]|uniref:Uncharacterized protein n=1 Tax=Trichonephila inaurata madagascariensis TaxID=2747483 RepID=A0A8X6YAG9_9ARAC|nr:uncharacterized protein TNIN_72221 [Trichonephila inaurata madagascariensis]